MIPPLAALVAATGLSGLLLAAQGQLQRLLGETVQQTMVDSILDVTGEVPLETFENPEFHDALQRVRLNAVLQPMNLSQALVQLFGGGAGVLVLAIRPRHHRAPPAPGSSRWRRFPRRCCHGEAGTMEFQFRVRETPTLRVRDYLQNVLWERDEAKEIRAFDLGEPLKRRWAESYGVLPGRPEEARGRPACGSPCSWPSPPSSRWRPRWACSSGS